MHFHPVRLELWMIQPKTQLLLIYITLTCLLITLGLFFQPKLLWLALPFVLIVIYSSLDIWLPNMNLFTSNDPEQEPVIDEDLTISGFEFEHEIETKPESIDNNVLSFENYQHIKKALATHQKKFPHARIHSRQTFNEHQ